MSPSSSVYRTRVRHRPEVSRSSSVPASALTTNACGGGSEPAPTSVPIPLRPPTSGVASPDPTRNMGGGCLCLSSTAPSPEEGPGVVEFGITLQGHVPGPAAHDPIREHAAFMDEIDLVRCADR